MLIFVAFLKYCSMFSFNVVNHSYIRLLKLFSIHFQDLFCHHFLFVV